MFCVPDTTHHHHTHRGVLRSFRSHKSLKAESQRHGSSSSNSSHSHHLQITHPHFDHSGYQHIRQLSEASSVARSSMESSRPSTSGTGLSTSFIEWDPLRLHPPMAAAPRAPGPERRSQHNLRHSRSLHSLHGRARHDPAAPVVQDGAQPASYRSLQMSRSSELEIHEGFDFGFRAHGDDDDSTPQPQTAWSSPSTNASDDFDEVDGGGARRAAEWGNVTPRPSRVRDNDADYFMKRGGWKRRGIVFAPSVPMADEEECFDLDL